MKKQIIYLVLTLFVFGFFACDFDFQIPQNIQIKGSREIKLTTSKNLANMLHDQLIANLDMEQFKILRGTQGQQLTYVIYMDVMPGGMEIDIPFDFTEFFDANMVVDVVRDMVTQGELLENVDHNEVGILVSDLEGSIQLTLDNLEVQVNDMIGDFDFEFPGDFPISFDLQSLVNNIFTGSGDGSLADSLVEAIREKANENGVISVSDLVDVITDNVTVKIHEAIVTQPLLLEDDVVLPGFGDPIAIPSLGIISDFLKNFKLSDDFDAQLYLSVKDEDGEGISFFNKIRIDLAWDDQFDPLDEENFIEKVTPSSNDPGNAFSGDAFTAAKLPVGIPLADIAMELLKQEAPAEDEEGKGVYIQIYIDSKGDDPLMLDFLNKTFTIKAELAIMLPLEIGVSLEGKYPLFDGLPDGEDILGRSLEDLDGGIMGDVIEGVKSLAFKIEFNKPVFNGLKLIVENRGFENDHSFEIALSDNKLQVLFPGDFIDKINNPDYYPFIPDVYLYCDDDAYIKFPKDLTLEKIALDVTFETKPIPIVGGF